MITHDSRTQELAEFAGIPYVSAGDVTGHDLACLDELKRVIPEDGLERFREVRQKNAVIYRHFIETVGLRLRVEHGI